MPTPARLLAGYTEQTGWTLNSLLCLHVSRVILKISFRLDTGPGKDIRKF